MMPRHPRPCITTDGKAGEKTQAGSAATGPTVRAALGVVRRVADDAAAPDLDGAAVEQALAQPLAAPLHPRFGAGQGDTEALRHRLLGQAVQVREGERRAVNLGQPGDQGPNALRQLGDLIACRLGGGQVFGDGLPGALGPVMVGDGVGGDPVQPRGQAAAGADPGTSCGRAAFLGSNSASKGARSWRTRASLLKVASAGRSGRPWIALGDSTRRRRELNPRAQPRLHSAVRLDTESPPPPSAPHAAHWSYLPGRQQS